MWLEFWVLSGLTECLRKRRQTFSTYLSFRISCLAFNVQSPLPRLAFNSVQDFWLLSADSLSLSLSLSLTTTCHFSPTMNVYALPINQLFLLLFNFHKIILLCFNWNQDRLNHISNWCNCLRSSNKKNATTCKKKIIYIIYLFIYFNYKKNIYIYFRYFYWSIKCIKKITLYPKMQNIVQ